MFRKITIAFLAVVFVGLLSGASVLLAAGLDRYELWDEIPGSASAGYIILPTDTQESIFDTATVSDWHMGNLMPHAMPLNPTDVPPAQYTIVSDATYFYTTETLSGSFAGIIHTRNPGDSYWNYGEGTWTSNLGWYGTWTGYFEGGEVNDNCTISMKYWSPKYQTYLPCGSITGTCTATQSVTP